MVPDSRTPNKGSKWRATCAIEGREYAAESRNGAPHALARILVGIEDQPVTVICEPVAGDNGKMSYGGGEIAYKSLHWMAGHTLRESATQPLHLARYQEHPGAAAFTGAGVSRIAEKEGISPPEAPQQPPAPETQKTPFLATPLRRPKPGCRCVARCRDVPDPGEAPGRARRPTGTRRWGAWGGRGARSRERAAPLKAYPHTISIPSRLHDRLCKSEGVGEAKFMTARNLH
jgi:hypothetical protein